MLRGLRSDGSVVATYLDHILAFHRKRAASDTRSVDRLIGDCADLPEARGFRSAIQATLPTTATARHGVAVIAEVKRRSPSKGLLAPNIDAAQLGAAYAAGGATCLSVLTDGPHFGGSAEDLHAARTSSGLPVLRKDFTVSLLDVCDARLMGADCVLLIAAGLDDRELLDFRTLAAALGIDVLVEIHDERELDRALAAGADLIGVNQRDLLTFEVDHSRALRMAPLLPSGVIRVAESGVRTPADSDALATAGYHAVLVGESLVRSPDPQAAVTALRGSATS